ncbi:MAG: cytochrome C oxidase subunit II, partial [Thermoanaerobaculia bacterium]|nr:cytochrome C oxidase subunit II [Thermoanaerobaculia bacterium]
MSLHSAIVPPQGVWWKPAGRQERIWVAIAFAWCLVLFAMMPFWHLKGGQNPSGIRSKVDNAAFVERVQRFIDDYQVGEEGGIPVV